MKIKKTILRNGVRVLSSPSKDTKSVVILFMIKTGSRNETKEVRGISHFLEHMVFKGTKKRPTALDISKEIDSLGAQNNAYTAKEYTVFFIKTISSNFEKSFEILNDIVFNSLFRKTDIALESKVILEERKMYEENPMAYINDLFEQTYFDDKKLSQDILGDIRSIKGMNKKVFADYRKKHYIAGNLIVSLAGDVPGNYLKICEKHLSRMREKEETEWDSSISGKKKSKVKIKYLKNKQSNIIVGYPGLPYNDENFLTLKILSGVLGGGMSSRLFQEIREKRGLAYYISSDIGMYSDDGYLEIGAGIDSGRVFEALEIVKNEVSSLGQKISKEEIKVAKERLKGKVSFGMEDSFGRADFHAKNEIYKVDLESLESIISDIDSVKLSDVRVMSDKIFSVEPTIAVIGPFKDKEKFVKILE